MTTISFRACLIVDLKFVDWEKMSPSTGPGAMLYQFCDALEVKGGQIADRNGWGLKHAIQAALNPCHVKVRQNTVQGQAYAQKY